MADVNFHFNVTSVSSRKRSGGGRKNRWLRKKKRRLQRGDQVQERGRRPLEPGQAQNQNQRLRCPDVDAWPTPLPAGPRPSLMAMGHRPAAPPPGRTPAGPPSKYLAIDCEMVGSGPRGRVSQLARCSIVSYDGDVVYDKYVSPDHPVTDYRTRWSGIRRRDLDHATPYRQARKEILKLLVGKVVVGHAVHNDFQVLGYSHPPRLIRDTSRIPALNRRAGFNENECASLKRLMKAVFNREIQTGRKGHSSVEDARASMELFRLVEAEWETAQ